MLISMPVLPSQYRTKHFSLKNQQSSTVVLLVLFTLTKQKNLIPQGIQSLALTVCFQLTESKYIHCFSQTLLPLKAYFQFSWSYSLPITLWHLLYTIPLSSIFFFSDHKVVQVHLESSLPEPWNQMPLPGSSVWRRMFKSQDLSSNCAHCCL